MSTVSNWILILEKNIYTNKTELSRQQPNKNAHTVIIKYYSSQNVSPNYMYKWYNTKAIFWFPSQAARTYQTKKTK